MIQLLSNRKQLLRNYCSKLFLKSKFDNYFGHLKKACLSARTPRPQDWLAIFSDNQ